MSERGDDRFSMYGDEPVQGLGPVARALIKKARGDGGQEGGVGTAQMLDEREEFFGDIPAPLAKEGVKFDSGKLRMDLLPPDVLEALAQILTDGAVKYGNRNWERGMAWSRPYAALMRHLLAFWGGQDIDPESGHPHLWHVMTNAAFLVAYQQREIGEDDRPEVWL
jgi:hypothetical protein